MKSPRLKASAGLSGVVTPRAVPERAGPGAGGRAGREVRYTVRTEPLGETARWMNRLASQWDARLAAIKRLAEEGAAQNPDQESSP